METNNLTYEIKEHSEKEWSNFLDLFDDANIYQTRAFSMHSKGGNNLEYCIVKKNDSIVAIALIRLMTLPLLNKGIAYVRWGPLWKIKDQPVNINNLSYALESLHKEYVIKRKLVVRITTNLHTSSQDEILPIFSKNNFKLSNDNIESDDSILVNIEPSLEDIRMNLHRKWRYNLTKSGKEELEIINGKDLYLFDIFLELYEKMHSKKQFAEFVNVSSFKDIQTQLVEKHKMNILICKSNNEPVAALVGPGIGNTGIYLLGASTDKGRDLRAGYLLQLEMIKWLKSNNCIWYDLGGIDAKKNPGVYNFKKGMGKKISYIGIFEAGNNFISKNIIQLAQLVRK